jgi:hypothetical protein
MNTEHHYFYCALTAVKYKKPYIYVKHYLKAPFTAIHKQTEKIFVALSINIREALTILLTFVQFFDTGSKLAADDARPDFAHNFNTNRFFSLTEILSTTLLSPNTTRQFAAY